MAAGSIVYLHMHSIGVIGDSGIYRLYVHAFNWVINGSSIYCFIYMYMRSIRLICGIDIYCLFAHALNWGIEDSGNYCLYVHAFN